MYDVTKEESFQSIIYMIYKVVKTKRNPCLGELYTDLKQYKEIKALAE